jgi:peptide/nickel transport system permease protein
MITFALFFFVNSPDSIANVHLGNKYVNDAVRQDWKKIHGYDLPIFYNKSESNIKKITHTLFFEKSVKLFMLDFGVSDTGRDIIQSIKSRYLPSLLIAVPTLIMGVGMNIMMAMILVFFRGTYIDQWGIFVCIALLSISGLFYIIGGQYIIAKVLRLLPISGYVNGWYGIKFLILPVLIGVAAGVGAGARWYRALFVEEIQKDYVRTARAKGLSEFQILFNHVLKNALIPILTGIVAILPLLFMGSLLMESFFGVPGLGSYTVDAIRDQDFAVIRVMVFLGTVLYILGLLLTDISYVLVDPRVKLQ